MDNSNSFNISNNHDEPIPFDNNDNSPANISHSPLNLGGGDTTEIPEIEISTTPAKPLEKKITDQTVPLERITGVKTFFTKLHAGAIEFLDGQITKWLNDNPDIIIKRTDVVTGEIQGKKNEPNIIITVWY